MLPGESPKHPRSSGSGGEIRAGHRPIPYVSVSDRLCLRREESCCAGCRDRATDVFLPASETAPPASSYNNANRVAAAASTT
jgi:hypothetical protein